MRAPGPASPGPASPAHAGSSRGRGKSELHFHWIPRASASAVRGCLIPAWKCWCLNSSAALNPPFLTDRGCSGLCWSPPLSRLGGAGWELLWPSPDPAIALPSSTSCWGQEPPPDGWNAASRDWNGHLPSLCSPVSPPGDDTCVPWGVESPLCAQAIPMLCQECHPPLPPGACSSGMRMGLVLSPGCLVLLSCPFPHPLPLSRPRDDESRAGTGRAQLLPVGILPLAHVDPKARLGSEEQPWHLHGSPLPPGRSEQLQYPSPPALRTVTPCSPQHPSARAFTLLGG